MSNSKYPYYPMFEYVKHQMPELNYSKLKILDFGGNEGNLLRDPSSEITPEKYTCLDVDVLALARGEKRFPGASWVPMLSYNPVYNPLGEKQLRFPSLGCNNFDLIFCYSVFTHMTVADLYYHLKEFALLLGDTGTLAFTLIDEKLIKHFFKKRWMNNKGVDVEKLLAVVAKGQFHYYVDDFNFLKPEIGLRSRDIAPCQYFLSVYSSVWMANLFGESNIRPHTDKDHQKLVVLNQQSLAAAIGRLEQLLS